jgi:hypothetical protein
MRATGNPPLPPRHLRSPTAQCSFEGNLEALRGVTVQSPAEDRPVRGFAKPVGKPELKVKQGLRSLGALTSNGLHKEKSSLIRGNHEL